MTLGDGTVVRLGGIAWSEEAPLAYLNGKLYAKGESVSGLTIEAIERDRVLLRSASGRISLKLK
jgi:type II secretory pathway component PulC